MTAEPHPREYPFSAAVDRQLCVYGGNLGPSVDESPTIVSVFECDSEKWMLAKITKGTHPPPNFRHGACTYTDNRIILLQGGWDGEQFYNTLFQLDFKDYKWTQLSSSDDKGAPIAKYGHGIVHHKPSNNLFIFGGYGPQPTGSAQPGAQYHKGNERRDRVWTNELHTFNLQEGQWSSPALTGRRPSPCRNFTLTLVDVHRAVLFGGRGRGGVLQHLYVLDIAELHWSQVDDDKGGPWPEGRHSHAAVCLGFGGDHPQLLITGGEGALRTLGDAWTLDLRSWRWREVKGHSLKRRHGHSTTAFTLSQEVTEVIMFGGVDVYVKVLADTTVLRFEWLEQPTRDGPPTKEWVLTDTATDSQLGTEQRVRKKEEIITSAGITEIAAAIEKDENIDRKHAQAMFIGPGGSGKSSLMERLIYRMRRHVYLSTGVADPVVIVDCGINQIFYAVSVLDSHTWEEVKFDKSLISQMHESVHSLRQQQAQAKMPEGNINALSDSIASPASTSASESNTMSGANRAAVPVARPASPSPVNPNIRQVISSAVIRHGGYSQFSNLIKKKFSLYLRDAGGHVEFQEIVSLLVFGPSIFLFVFRADQDLKSTFIVGYRMSASETINSYTSSISTEEALLQCLASVYAMETPDKATHNPYVLIVATHKDKLGPLADQKILQLNNSLKALINESGFESLVVYADAAKGQVVFPVDNTSESDDDFIPIRSKIHTLIMSREEFTIKYPMSYLLFCLELQSDQRSVLTLEECKAMAAKYKILGDQVFKLLYFLHLRIGVVHFINIEGVKCIVMKRPEDLFSKVTDLVVKTFSCGALTVEEAYRRKGILTASAFESVISRQDAITASEFLKILVHLRIIAEFTKDGEKEKRYFIPCVLNHVSESTGRELETDIASLAVKFECKHCPKGLFGVLVTHLMTPEAGERKGCFITFALRDDKIFKDQVFFAVQCSGDFDTISLKAYSTHLEIKFFPGSLEDRDEPVSFACEEVRKAIAESINKSLVDLHYSREKLKPSVCLRCTQKSCSDLHPVFKGKNFHKIHCDKTGQTSRLPAQGRCWYNEGEPSPGVGSTGSATEASGHSHQPKIDTAGQCSSKASAEDSQTKSLSLQSGHEEAGVPHQPVLTMADHYAVTRHLRDLSNDDVIELGEALGLFYPHLCKMDRLLKDMVAAWLNKEDNVMSASGAPSWTSLIKALRDINQSGVAQEIEEDAESISHFREDAEAESSMFTEREKLAWDSEFIPQYRALKMYENDIVECLRDVNIIFLAEKIFEERITETADLKFLSPEVPSQLVCRYLFYCVYESIKSKNSFKTFNSWLNLLSRFKVNDDLISKVRLCCENLEKSHLADLSEVLVSCSDKWEDVGISLGLPDSEIQNIAAMVHATPLDCLTKILSAWIACKFPSCRPPTLHALNEALCSSAVGLSKEVSGNFVQAIKLKYSNTSIDIAEKFEIFSQANQSVTEGTSVLLEVQVSAYSMNSVTFYWEKDGKQIDSSAQADDSYGCHHVSMILIHAKNLRAEGTYTCCIELNELKESIPIKLKVITPLDNYQISPYEWHSTCITLALRQRVNFDDQDGGKNLDLESVLNQIESGARLLVTGPPGSGKTTLMHEISQTWANRSANVKLLFMVNLKSFSHHISLNDIFGIYFENSSDRAELEQYAEQHSGLGFCFVLDGLNEYLFKYGYSYIFQLINKEVLPESVVIMSSRSSAASSLSSKASMQIEVLGFLETQVFELINSYSFSDSSKQVELHRYLDHHPFVLRMCCLPFCAFIMCSFFDHFKDLEFLNTETKLYELLTKYMICRSQHRLKEINNVFSFPIEDVAGLQRREYFNICEVAFKMCTTSACTFMQEEANLDTFNLFFFDKIGEIGGDFQTVGSFLHPTFQEFLCGCYIAGLDQARRAELIQNFSDIKMQQVWKFYCGLIRFDEPCNEFIQLIANSRLSNYRDFFAVQCAFESQQAHVCSEVVKNNGLTFDGATLSLFHAKEIDFVLSNTRNHVSELSFATCKFVSDCALYLANFLKLCTDLERLNFSSTCIGDAVVEIIADNIKHCSKLVELNFECNVIRSDGAKAFARNLKHYNNLQELNLKSNKICADGAEALTEGLQQSKSLRNVLLDLNDIDEDRLREFSDHVEYLVAYRQVLASSECIDMYFVKAILFGPSGLGKTTVRRRLMGEIDDIKSSGGKVEPSTGVVDSGHNMVVQKIKSALITSSEWRAIKNLSEEVCAILELFHAHFKGSLQKPEKAAEPAVVIGIPAKVIPSAGIIEKLSSEQDEEAVTLPPQHFSETSTAADVFPSQPSGASDASSTPHARQLYDQSEFLCRLRNALKTNSWKDVQNILEDMIFLWLEDTGGQPEFMDMLPALTIGPALYLLFCKLTDDLQSPYCVSYRCPGATTDETESVYSVEEVLHSALASIDSLRSSSMSYQNSEDEKKSSETTSKLQQQLQSNMNSMAYIIGTHKDQVDEKKIEKFDKELQSSIRSAGFFRKNLVWLSVKGKMVYPIDNMTGGKEEVEEIQNFLERRIKDHFNKLSIPPAWLMLSLHLRLGESKVANFDDVSDAAMNFGIPKDEVKLALWFLHRYAGVLMYFPKVLADTVICDTKIVYSSTTNLIVSSFRLDSDSHKIHAKKAEKFWKIGQFSLQDLKDATRDVTESHISLKDLVKLLEHLNIITPINAAGSSEIEYFMPCVLQNATRDEVEKWWEQHSNSVPAPLFIRCECGFMPIGIFSALVAKLCGKNESGVQLMLLDDEMKKNLVHFKFGCKEDFITLVSQPKYYAIHISQGDSESLLHEVCSEVRELVVSTLKIVASNMNYSFQTK